MNNFPFGKIHKNLLPVLSFCFIFLYGSFFSKTLSAPVISLSPTEVNFGVVSEEATYWNGFYIRNSGDEKLHFDLSRTHQVQFFYFPLTDSVSVGDSLFITVAFHPTLKKNYIDSIVVSSDDPGTPQISIVVLGRYSQQEIFLSINLRNFGDVLLGDSSSYQLGIYNQGYIPLIVSDIQSSNPSFYVSEDNFTIDSISNKYITVIFKPLQMKDFYDSLTISSDDPNNPVEKFIMTGRGIWPNVGLFNNTVDFNEVSISDTGKLYLPLYNSGSAELLIDTITGISGSDTFYFGLSNTSESISPNDSSSILVKFTPQSEIMYYDTLTVDLSRPDTSLKVYLRGRGILSRLALSADSINFGEVWLNQTSTYNLVIQNLASASGGLKINHISYDSANIFEVDTTSKTISPGESITLPIKFNPKTRMQYIDTLKFTSNDTGKANVRIILRGLGIAPLVSYNPSSICNFDSVNVVGPAKSCSLTVINNGNTKLTIESIIHPSILDSVFTIGISTGDTVGKSSSRVFYIYFSPNEGKIFNDSFFVNTNDPNNLTKKIYLYGIGKAPEISVVEQTHDFGDLVAVGDSSTWNLKVFNYGTDTLRIDSISAINKFKLPDKIFKTSFTISVLNPNETLSVAVKYLPKQERRYLDTLKIYSNANKNPVLPVVAYSNLTKNYYPIITSIPGSLVNDTVSVNEDTIYKYRITAEDLDIDPLHLTIKSPPGGLSADTLGYANYEMNWEINWVPTQVNVGVNQIFIIAEDNKAKADTQIYYVKVNNINGAPVISAIPDTNAYVDSLFTIQINAVDEENDSLTYSLLVYPVGLTMSSSGFIQWKPKPGDNGSQSDVYVRVSDDKGGISILGFKIRVSYYNYKPEIISHIDTVSISEDYGSFIVADLDTIFFDRNAGTILEYSVISDTSGLTVNISEENVFSITPQKDYFGISKIILIASDGEKSVSDTITINVLPVNDPPIIISFPDTTIFEDSLFTYQVEVKDVDSDSFKYKLLIYPYEMTIDSSGLITWLPNNDDVGDTVVKVIGYDNAALSDTQTFKLKIKNVNNPPIIIGIPDLILFEDSKDTIINLYNYVSDIDNKKEEITFQVSHYNYNYLNVIINVNELKMKPILNWNGMDTVIITAIDPDGAFSKDTIKVSVLPVNDPPKILNLNDLTFNEDDSLTLFLNRFVSDVDDSVKFLIWEIKGGVNIKFSLSDTVAIFWAPLNWNGEEYFTFILKDPSWLKDSVTVKITIKSVNDTPVIVNKNIAFTINEEESLKVSYKDWAYDIDGDDIKWEFKETKNIKLFLDSVNKEVLFSPVKDYFGKDTVKVFVNDLKGGLDSGLVIFTIINVNDSPVIVSVVPDEDTVFVKKQGNVRFEFTAYDPDNDILLVYWNLDGNIVSSNDTFLYTAGEKMEKKSLRLIISDGKRAVSRDWAIMSGWEVSVIIASFYGIDTKENGIKIVWETLQSQGNLGFNIARCEDEKENYVYINNELIMDEGRKQFIYFDNNIESNKKYFYKLESISITGSKSMFGPVSVSVSSPEKWKLSQNYPNPFNTETTINFNLPKSSDISVIIYDIKGAVVRILITAKYPAGYYSVKWDGKNSTGFIVSSGIYFCELRSKEIVLTRKIVLAK